MILLLWRLFQYHSALLLLYANIVTKHLQSEHFYARCMFLDLAKKVVGDIQPNHRNFFDSVRYICDMTQYSRCFVQEIYSRSKYAKFLYGLFFEGINISNKITEMQDSIGMQRIFILPNIPCTLGSLLDDVYTYVAG